MPRIEDSLLKAKWCEEEDLSRAREALRDPSILNVVAFFQLPFRVRLEEKWFRLDHPQKPPSYVYFRPVGTRINALDKDYEARSLQITKGPGFSDITGTLNAELRGDQFGAFIRTQALLSVKLWGFWAEKYPSYLAAIESSPKEMLYPHKVLDEETKLPWTAEYFESRLVRRIGTFSWELLNLWLPCYRVACLAPEARQLEAVDNYFLMDKKGRVVPAGQGQSEIERKLRTFRKYPAEDRENANRLAHRLRTRPVVTVYEEYLLNALLQIDLGHPELAFVQTVMTVEWFFNEIVSNRLVQPIYERLSLSPEKIKDYVRTRIEFSNRGPLDERIKTYLGLLNLELPEKAIWSDFLRVVKRRNQLVHRLSKRDVTVDEARSAVACGIGIIDSIMTQLLERKRD